MNSYIKHKKDIIEVPNFFSQEECNDLIKYFESSSESWMETCFYNARVMDPLAPNNKNNNKIIKIKYFMDLRYRFKKIAEESLGIKLKNLTLSAHKWLPGSFASDHADNAELDGTPNAWQDNKVVTIIYLNDDYEGGNLTFRDHNLSLAPKSGTLMIFDVGINNVHGVSKIESGERYTMLASWDYESSVYPDGFLESLKSGKMSQKYIQDKQKEDWKSGKV